MIDIITYFVMIGFSFFFITIGISKRNFKVKAFWKAYIFIGFAVLLYLGAILIPSSAMIIGWGTVYNSGVPSDVTYTSSTYGYLWVWVFTLLVETFLILEKWMVAL